MDAQLRQILIAGPAAREVLQARLGVSQPTISRLLTRHADQIRVLGRGRATRYGLRRSVRDLSSELPVYRISAQGRAQQIGCLCVLHGGYWYEDGLSARDSRLFPGLPWFLVDMRPQGFLGRGYSYQHPDLGLPERLVDWQDDHVLYGLALRGEDASGNLLIGETSFARWVAASGEPMPLTLAQRAQQYPRRAEQALAGGWVGSSAGGEQPKFTALLAGAEGPAQVLVKFSEPLDTPTGQRWGDLLLAEHHALAVIAASGLPAAASEVLDAGNRRFLQVDRFDRVGARGRRGLISFAALDDEFVGQRRHWLDTAQALQQQRMLGAEDVRRVAWLQAFGGFIGNTDMHFGNLSVCYEGGFPTALAPAYDMLPMHYAPQRGELRTPVFTPAPPPAQHLDTARQAREAAQQFWQLIAGDVRISAEFRALATANAAMVAALQW